ncbi:unnamed protein product [Ectocarpus sp. CCAP 1310/34]|nr:unnamed protein product [Ectocarpus sp. CCAP 1310/34]
MNNSRMSTPGCSRAASLDQMINNNVVRGVAVGHRLSMSTRTWDRATWTIPTSNTTWP